MVQPPTAEPRQTLTTGQVVAIIQDAAAVQVSAGLQLLDLATLTVVEDISDDLQAGDVSRDSYAILHGTARLTLTRELDWGNAVVRPYLTLSDGSTSATFRLGAYFTATPSRTVNTTPARFDVTGYDILHALTSPVGGAYAVDAGTAYLDTVETILTTQGYGQFTIDPASAASTLPSPKVWPFDDQTTWLQVVNDLLAEVGYAGIWSDWDGRLRCQPYQPPRTRGPEWFYDSTDADTAMLGVQRTVERDFFNAPNRWVFYRRNNIDSTAPVEGNGIYTYVNDSLGDTSVAARGRVITRIVPLDVADQAAMEAVAQITIDADLRPNTTLQVSTAPNPLHWHFDRALLNDPGVGPIVDVLCTKWTLPLDGGDQQQTWVVLT